MIRSFLKNIDETAEKAAISENFADRFDELREKQQQFEDYLNICAPFADWLTKFEVLI